jgi:hypothetical protein
MHPRFLANDNRERIKGNSPDKIANLGIMNGQLPQTFGWSGWLLD